MKHRNAISRRDLLQSVGAIAAADLLGSSREGGAPATSPLSASTGDQPPRILALIGDRYHNPDYIRVSLGQTLRRVAPSC